MKPDLFNFRDFFSAFHRYPWWQIAIEWLLIGGVIWGVGRFLRGTRGARMVKGTVLLLVTLYLIVGIVGEQFGLQRIEFLYGKFLLVVTFAVIVVFQPELRRALVRLGETSLFRGMAGQINEQVEALVDAATFLSRRKIGALIAIERDIGLGGMAESATRLDAQLSAPLLDTIFWPNSPLHDLGVVVSRGRITHAGVQFPLAESGELDRELGSRHRAAVGLSQETDAVVIVVSEETGDISVAERGQLVRKLTPEGLRALLLELLAKSDGRSLHKAAA